MDDISNKSLGNRKRKSLDYCEGKENVSNSEPLIIDRPPSFGFDLGVNSAINRGSPVYKELMLNLKSPKVSVFCLFDDVLYLKSLF
jgi:hypothetical protein